MDGKVGAIIEDGTSFITSPNTDIIQLPPLGQREVFACEDGLYSDDDPMQWPQPFNQTYCHYGAIPRPETLPEHEVIWWEPTYDDFVRLSNPVAPIGYFGKLAEGMLIPLTFSVNYAIQRVQEYMGSMLPEHVPSNLALGVKMMQHGLSHLESLMMNFRHLLIGVRDIQCCWLEVIATLDWQTKFWPIMEGAGRMVFSSPPKYPEEQMGVFTNDVRIAQDFYLAGLPVWLICPAEHLSGVNILETVNFI
jgi:hypothetical protein